MLLRIPCILRALTNRDGDEEAGDKSLAADSEMLRTRGVGLGVLSDPDSGFVSTSPGYHTGLLFRT